MFNRSNQRMFSAAMLVTSSLVLAGEIQVSSSGDCNAGVHRVARDAQLSAMLKRLAQALDRFRQIRQLRTPGEREGELEA